ncbi:MAG: GNAT family N-acetyltransferase [Acidobacteriota bacterium]|nr:GNAT family N-acetyltransferase [Acidobacteriota bacterium]
MRDDVAFSIATRADDAGIRRLLSSNPIPGKIRIRYEREPDYFAGCATMGATQVLVARADERVIGVACRAIRSMYINGDRAEVGYLGQLRVDPNFRGRWLVLRGFRKLQELHRQSPPRGYVTTIIEGNDEAEGVLVRRARGPMPRYRKIDRLMTLALPVWSAAAAATAFKAAPAGAALQDIVAFLNREGRRKNFFPVYDEQSFTDDTTRGFDPKDFIVIERDGAIAGVAGLWDQSAYKQSIVDAYDPLTRAVRPIYNTAAKMLHRATLPKPGTALRFGYGSFFCAMNDDPNIARELIVRLLSLARERRLDHLLLGFTESDPLLATARQFRHVAYPAGVFTVAWDDGNDLTANFHDGLDSRPRFLEIASL